MDKCAQIISTKEECIEFATKCVNHCKNVKMLTAKEYATLPVNKMNDTHIEFYKANGGKDLVIKVKTFVSDDTGPFDIMMDVFKMMNYADALTFWEGKDECFVDGYRSIASSTDEPQYMCQQREFKERMKSVKQMIKKFKKEIKATKNKV